MSGTSAPLGTGNQIIIAPGQTGTFGYTGPGQYTGQFYFTPLQDGISFMGGSTNFNIKSFSPNGQVVESQINVPNNQPTVQDITVGYPSSEIGMSEVQISNQPAVGADGGVIPNVPGYVPGSSAINTAGGVANTTVQTSQSLSQTRFAVTYAGSDPKKAARTTLQKADSSKHCDTCDEKSDDKNGNNSQDKSKVGDSSEGKSNNIIPENTENSIYDPNPMGPSQNFQQR